MTTRVGDGFGDYMSADDGQQFPPSRSDFTVGGVMQSLRNLANVSEALRILGAAVLLASMSVFLLQGWNTGNDIQRYLLLLTQTGLLAAAGFAMSHGLKETKGARIFFGLALVSIPANFTILGALLYSVFQWDAGLGTYPGFATWRIEDVASTGITLGGAMLVLVPVTLFCFAIMARQSARALSLHFLLLNLLLLLPIRSSMAAGTIALLGVLYALYVVRMLAGKDGALKTAEGKFALTTLFLPIGIILFRSMYFYQVDSLMIAMFSLALFLTARQASQFPDRNERVALTLEVLSTPFALVVAMSLTDALAPFIARALHAPVFAALYTVLALDILHRTNSAKLAWLVGVSISLFVAFSFTLSVAVSPSGLTALLSLMAGGSLLIGGLALGSVIAAFAGIFTMLAAAFFGFEEIVRVIVDSSWIELAIIGASAIALGSVLDRHGVPIKLRLVKWFDAVGKRNRRTTLED